MPCSFLKHLFSFIGFQNCLNARFAKRPGSGRLLLARFTLAGNASVQTRPFAA